MKVYHIYFYILNIIILILLTLISLKKIKNYDNIKIIIDSLFKLSIGLFILFFFLNTKLNNLSNNDKVLIILSGFILILLVNYRDFIKIIVNS